MSDLSESIFKLWGCERALRQVGKWPEGAPRLTSDGSYLASVNGVMLPVARDAAIWRIVQFVAWAVRGKDDAVSFDADGNTPWCEAQPHHWIAEATAIVQGWEAKA